MNMFIVRLKRCKQEPRTQALRSGFCLAALEKKSILLQSCETKFCELDKNRNGEPGFVATIALKSLHFKSHMTKWYLYMNMFIECNE